MLDDLDALMQPPTSPDAVDRHVETMVTFAGHDSDTLGRRWGGFLLRDNELMWMAGEPSIDDV